MQVIAEQKAQKINLKGNKQAMSEALLRMRKMVHLVFLLILIWFLDLE